MTDSQLRILHLSDLHRTGDDPLTNTELLNGIQLHLGQMAGLGDDFTQPDAIVVSGDLVQGVSSSSADPVADLKQQNGEALNFLVELAEMFVGSDRSRVIILPGNHDVERATAQKAMKKVDSGKEPRNLGKELANPQSSYRWCWRERCLYKIFDRALYDQKMDGYRETVTTFYNGTDFQIGFDAWRAWNHFPLSENVVVTAFDNCKHIDGYRFAASIHPHDVATANVALGKASLTPKLKIAAWHHNISGPPLKNDYLDSSELSSLLNCGYRIGLHGHQHLPDAVPFSLHTSTNQTMTVLSVGSLGAADAELAPGCRQQFSALALDVASSTGRVWIREMISRAVFGPGHIRSRSSEIYTDITWTPAPNIPIVRTSNHGGVLVETADKIEMLLAEKNTQEALLLIERHKDSLGGYGRSLHIRCLQQEGDWTGLINLIASPFNAEETTYLVKAHVYTRQKDRAQEAVNGALSRDAITVAYANELKNWIRSEAMK
jgi:hypothetical protein